MVGEREDVDVGDDAPQRGVSVPGGLCRRNLGDARVTQERVPRVPGTRLVSALGTWEQVVLVLGTSHRGRRQEAGVCGLLRLGSPRGCIFSKSQTQAQA